MGDIMPGIRPRQNKPLSLSRDQNPVTEQASAADARQAALHHWLTAVLDREVRAIAPASSDASFRRYFRVEGPEGSLIVMDAPPEHEDCRPFLAVAAMLAEIGVNVPRVLAQDLTRGFLLLTDLGNRRYLDELNDDCVERLYGDAMAALARLQAHGPRDGRLPPYDHAMLMREMALFPEWLLDRHLGLRLDAGQRDVLAESFELLARSALEQPRVMVHRDYHSRNLMIVDADNPGVLDFQDAVVGPITYDLVSLLRDCYIAWPRERVEAWALAYRHRPGVRELVGAVDDATWLRWFDWMGLQRHLKASGIFARLWHRDGKPGYLPDVPRTLGYMVEVSGRYPELAGLHRLLVEQVVPGFERTPWP